MICNCNNNNQGTSDESQMVARLVYGNVLRLAIPLTLRTITLVDGKVETEDTPFIPSPDYPVIVQFDKRSAITVKLEATMRDDNIAFVEDKGNIPIGTYSVTVLAKDDNGDPYRFKQNAVLKVVDATKDAGIEAGIEYEATTWYLDAAIYLALKGEDGVGIEDITTESSMDVGGMNTITITMTNGETRTFTVMNGSGSVDDKLDPTSGHPVANRVVTARFNEMSSELAGLFGNVDYDTTSKSIRFWDKDKTNVLASLDARPFIKDGMVSNVYISNNTLVITFNTDAGREAIGVPLSSVFNPNNYYTKTQVDNRISSVLANYYTKSSIEALLETKADVNGSRYDEFGALGFDLYGQDEPDLLVKASATVDHQDESVTITFSDAYNYENDKLSYTFDSLDQRERHIATEEFVKEYVSEYGGDEQVQADWEEADTGDAAYIRNKPVIPDVSGLATKDDVDNAVAGLVSAAPATLDTLKELADALGDDPNFATTMATALGGKVDKETGKSLMTDAERTKLAGLSNYDDTALRSAVAGKAGKMLVVNITYDRNGVYSADKTLEQITAANSAGNTVVAKLLSGYYNLSYLDDNRAVFIMPFDETPSLSFESFIVWSDGSVGYQMFTTADVAYTGSYNDLTDKPTIPAAQVNVDWNATSGVSQILNKPTFKTINGESIVGTGDIEAGSGNVVTPVVNVASTGNVTQELQAGAFYKFGTVDSLTITLATGNTPLDGTTPLLVYGGKFTINASSSASSLLALPASVTISPRSDSVDVGKTYEFNIADNVAIILEM